MPSRCRRLRSQQGAAYTPVRCGPGPCRPDKGEAFLIIAVVVVVVLILRIFKCLKSAGTWSPDTMLASQQNLENAP